MATYTGQRVGYMRVSAADQNLDRQRLAIGGCDKTFTDHASGGAMQGRQGLQDAMSYLRDGDLLVVASMDRLARSLSDLNTIVTTLTGKGVAVSFIKENLIFQPGAKDPYATFQLHLIGAVAELERSLIRERQREGIEAAKKRGAYKGRAHALTKTQAEELRSLANQGVSKASLAKMFGIGRTTVYRYLAEN